MKRIHLFHQKQRSQVSESLRGGKGTRQRFCCHSQRTKLGNSKLYQGYCLVRLNSLQQKGHFVVLELYPGFSWVWTSPVRLSSHPERLKPWLAHIHAGLPHYTAFYHELNSISSDTSRGILKWRYIPTPVEPVLLLSPSLSQKSLHLKHSNSRSSEPQIFSHHLLLRGSFLSLFSHLSFWFYLCILAPNL